MLFIEKWRKINAQSKIKRLHLITCYGTLMCVFFKKKKKIETERFCDG